MSGHNERSEFEIEEDLRRALESLKAVPPPDQHRVRATRSAFLAEAHRIRTAQPVSSRAVMRHTGRKALLPGLMKPTFAGKGIRMVAIVLAVIVALAAAGGGVTYAADGASPGDPLYGIDRAAEQTRLSLTASPAQAVRLQLAFADERLGEAEELAEADDGTNLSAAVDGYGDAVAAAAQELGQTRDRDQDQLRTLFDDSLGAQQGRLERVLTSNAYAFGRGSGVVDDDDDAGDEDDTGDEDDVDDEEDVDDTELDDDTEDTFTAACVGADPHPVGSSLAAQYDVPYETVMTWFCDDGFGFGEIMIALRVGDAVGEEPADLLTQSVEMDGWGHVLQSLGLIGHGQGNPHRPDLDEPTEEPTDEPTDEPTVEPTDEPTVEPTDEPGDDERPCGDTPGQGCGVGNDADHVPPGQSDDKPGNGNGNDNDNDHVPPGQSDDKPGNGNGNDNDHVPPGQSDDKPGNGNGNDADHVPPGQSEDHPGNGRGNNK